MLFVFYTLLRLRGFRASTIRARTHLAISLRYMFAWPKHNHAILCPFCLEWAVNAPFEKDQKERYVFDNVPGGCYILALRRPESSPGCHVLLYVRRQIMSLVLQYLANGTGSWRARRGRRHGHIICVSTLTPLWGTTRSLS